MPLRGQSAVVIWSDMADPAAHDLWHSREHLPERVAIPGFLRARRCVTLVADAPRYFVLYELKDAAILTSPAYLARLNQPTPWTAKTMESVRALSRTLCGVAASHGDGVGAHLMAIRLTPQASRTQELQTRLDDLLPKLAQQPGLVGAHLLQREQAVARPDTIERHAGTRMALSIGLSSWRAMTRRRSERPSNNYCPPIAWSSTVQRRWSVSPAINSST
jgi:hypothetical protein